jgi:photosystem II stability/assembly factor-like uncharacterized protein
LIKKTTNGGLNWDNQISNTQNGLQSVFFIDANTGWIGGLGGIILKTTNSGNNWFNQTSGTVYNLFSVFFLNSNTGWISGNNSRILKTTNGGSNWIDKSFGYENYRVHFIDANTGWIACNLGKVLKSTNGGDNWYVQTTLSCAITSLFFANSNTGWVVGSTVMKTTNGGTNWFNDIPNLNLEFSLLSVFFTDSQNGWAVGSYGGIIKTSTGGNILVRNISNETPNNFSLSQNYPNPFNPSTNIKYQITNNKLVTLKIYDILGKEVAMLVNEKQSPGVYEVTWDASQFPSGVYVYQLSIDNVQYSIKKMALIK